MKSKTNKINKKKNNTRKKASLKGPVREYVGGMNPPDRKFEKAIRDGSFEKVQKDMDELEIDINVRLPNLSEKAIHMATRRGHFDMVTLLLERGAKINDKDADNYRPIHHAADRMRLKDSLGKLEEKMNIAKLLIKNGARINVHSLGQHHTPLDLAAREGDLEMVELLVENGANVNNHKPLHLASKKGYLEIVTYLVEHGANLNEPDIEIGDDGADIETFVEEGRNSLQEYRVDVPNLNEPGIEIGPSPLHEAVRGGHFDVVEYLVEQGADINVTDDHYGKPINMIINLDSKPNYRKIAFFLMRRGIEDGTFNEADARYGLRDVYDRIQKEALLEPIIQRTVERQNERNEFAEKMTRGRLPENVIVKYLNYLGGKKKKRKTRRKTRKNKKTKKKSK